MNTFQSDCQHAINQISEEDTLAFNNAQDTESRIRIVYKYANTISVKLGDGKKNLKLAEEEKVKGNAYFAAKDYKNAIKSYNNGIINCPQDTDSSQEFLTILVANRSASFFEIKEYRKVLNDIDYITEIDKYPKHLNYKLLLRKAKCYDALHNEKLADEVYIQAFDALNDSGLDEEKITAKIKEIGEEREEIKGLGVSYELVKSPLCEEPFITSEVFVACVSKISFEQDMSQGRYATANEDIPAGQLIIQENAHGCVLSPENTSTNCQHCLISITQIFACPRCSTAVFCSRNCERLANRSYHRYECAFQKTLFESGASINCSLALRIIAQKDLKFFMDKKKKLCDFLKDHCKKTIKKITPYRADDYDTIFFLCRNEFSRNKEELLHYSCMSVYLLKLLKASNYFPKAVDDKLSDEELFVSALILRHLEVLQFNSHEIAELRNVMDANEDVETSYKLECIGAAIYPTAALFNHSCDPSIVRYNIGTKLIVRTIKPIKEGDIIYENYGPMYTTMKREFRQQFLSKRYWFDCTCVPCMENWPLMESLDENELRIGCPKCPYVFVINKTDIFPFLICECCGNRSNLFTILKHLMDLESILPPAEHLYGDGHYQEAIAFYLDALNLLYRHLKPPCPDMINVQQRLRTCFIHYGNKSIDYIQKQ